MTWIAPAETASANAALEQRLWDTADQFRANSGLMFLRFAAQRAKHLVPVTALLLHCCGCHSTAPRATPATVSHVQKPKVVRGVLPLVIQPDPAKWRRLQAGMTEGEVTALLGNPYRKDTRPPADTQPNVIQLYAWYYGEISFRSFTTSGSYYYTVTFHEGRVAEISDPWQGKFSPDGRPTIPELVEPAAGRTLAHFPRFLDFRWHPSSGVYPVAYEVCVQVLDINQHESEHFEDYVRKTLDFDREKWKAEGMPPTKMDEMAVSFARELRERQGVQLTFQFCTHDIYLPLTWVGANTGRWRVRATNKKGASEWTAWRYFSFST